MKTQKQIKVELEAAWTAYEAARQEIVAHNERCHSSVDPVLTPADIVIWLDISYAVVMWARIAHLTSLLPMSKGERRAADILAAGGSFHPASHYCGAARVYPAGDPTHEGYVLRESTVERLYLRGIITS